MEIHYQCNLSDYDEALNAQRSVKTTKIIVIAGFALVFISEVIAVNLGIRQGVATVAIVVLSLTFSLGVSIFRPRWIKKDFQNHPNFPREQTLLIDDSGLHWKTEVANNDTLWTAYTGYRETKNLFLLYLGKRLFQVIPKRALSSNDLDSLRELLREKLLPIV